MRPLLGSLLLLAAACGDPTVLDVRAYSQACATPADCAAVQVGDLCVPCGCANAVVAVSARARAEADAANGRKACGPVAAIACGPCQEVALACTRGACAVQ